MDQSLKYEVGISTTEFSQWKVAKLSGRVDALNCGPVLRELRRLMTAENSNWALDLTDVEFINVSALREFVRLNLELREKKNQFGLFRPAGPVLKHIEGFARNEFDIYFDWDQLKYGATFKPRAEHVNDSANSRRSLL